MAFFSFFRLKFNFRCRDLKRKQASIKEEDRRVFLRYDENDDERDKEIGGNR